MSVKSDGGMVDECRLVYGRLDTWPLRNNSGAFSDETGRLVRFGLGNDSQRTNALFKSSDLVGPRSVLITPEMVGRTVALFWARECKAPGWKYTGTPREVAQLRFLSKIVQMGGDAAFYSGLDVPISSISERT